MPRALLVANTRARAGTTGVNIAARRLMEHGFTVDATITAKARRIPQLIGERCTEAEVIVWAEATALST